MIKVVQINDKRAHYSEMKAPIKSEVIDLLRRGTFKVITRKEIPDGANALTARFVLATNSKADGDIKYKALYVVGGHRNIMNHFIVHDAKTLHASSVRILIALESVLHFKIQSTDVELAYL